MKNILVPIDFSADSNNAARYALELAAHIHAGITLFHVCSFPVLLPELPDKALIEEEELEKASIQLLEKLAGKLGEKFPQVPITCDSVFGEADLEILRKTEQSKADLVVIGAKGKSNVWERIFGSTTSRVSRHSKIPVLAVPAHARFRPVKNVLVACDNGKTFTKPITDGLRQFSAAFHAPLTLLRVVNIGEYMMRGAGIANEKELDEKLGDTPHVFDFEVMSEAVEGITRAVEKSGADIVVLISHKHNALAKIFNGTTTGQLLRQTKKPVLVIPEKITGRKVSRIFESEEVKS